MDNGSPAPDRVRRVAVVGAGLAGLRTAASLRAAGFRGEIVVLGAEGLPPYDRPPLSKELFLRPDPAWLASELGSDLMELADRVELATPAHAVSPAAQGRVALHVVGNERIEADVVVAASGSHARLPVDWTGAVVLHTAADADALRARLTPGTRVVCIGAGWIGSEISDVAAAQGCAVTVLEAAAAPLAAQVGLAVGRHLVPHFAARGVDLRLDAKVTSVHPDAVHLADGRRFAADLVLAAVGAEPATAWLEGVAALTERRAVAVDRFGRADGSRGGLADGTLWAVGDCADRLTERDGLVAGGHWAGALHDPELVAAGILGGPVPPSDPAPYVFSEQHGHHVTLLGVPHPESEIVFRGHPGDGPWTALYLERRADLPGGWAVLRAGFTVDAARDVTALRRMLGQPHRPVIDVGAATDVAHPLRDAVR